jgi:hypothetical protein
MVLRILVARPSGRTKSLPRLVRRGPAGLFSVTMPESGTAAAKVQERERSRSRGNI